MGDANILNLPKQKGLSRSEHWIGNNDTNGIIDAHQTNGISEKVGAIAIAWVYLHIFHISYIVTKI